MTVTYVTRGLSTGHGSAPRPTGHTATQMMPTSLIPWCPHVSRTGGEGPVAILGRMPVLWVCDECGAVGGGAR